MGLKKAALAALAGLLLLIVEPAAAQHTEPTDARTYTDARAVLLVGFSGPVLDPTVRRHLEDGGRGVILFSTNVVSGSQLKALTSSIACAAHAPVLIAVDQEPGPVQRLRGLVTPLPSPSELAEGTAENTIAVGARLGREMRTLGVSMNLAPLLDVLQGPNPVLSGRAIPGDVATVGAHGAALTTGLQSARVAATAKHFPGHGRSRTDPHQTVTRIPASLDALTEDLAPFHTAVEAGIKAVLVGHPVYEAIDPDYPASLSPAVLALLRDDLGFDGVAVTDGLAMKAVRAGRTLTEAAVQALVAGQDLLIIEDAGAVHDVVNAIVGAVERGELDRDRLAEAATRVRRLAAWAAQPPCRLPRPAVHRS